MVWFQSKLIITTEYHNVRIMSSHPEALNPPPLVPGPDQESQKRGLEQKLSETNYERRASVSFVTQILSEFFLQGNFWIESSLTASFTAVFSPSVEQAVCAYPDGA
jgi:hypothetical protein